MHSRFISLFALGAGVVVLLVATSRAQQPAGDVAIDPDDIGGVVTGPVGPEAGVWVIAETRELPVRYIKSVVTDDRGRFVVPDLPPATYTVWARGYGLVDSDKATAEARSASRDRRQGRPQTTPLPRTTTRPSIGTRCSRSPRPISSAARAASLRGCHRTSGLQP